MSSKAWHEKLKKIRNDWLGKEVSVQAIQKEIIRDYLGKPQIMHEKFDFQKLKIIQIGANERG